MIKVKFTEGVAIEPGKTFHKGQEYMLSNEEAQRFIDGGSAFTVGKKADEIHTTIENTAGVEKAIKKGKP